jgi:hypothetical protein
MVTSSNHVRPFKPRQLGVALRGVVLLLKVEPALRKTPFHVVGMRRPRVLILASSVLAAAALTALLSHYGACFHLYVVEPESPDSR